MGREIVQQENLNKPGERSRLWSHKEALEVLKEYKGTGKVEGLFLDFGSQEKNHEAENYLTDCDHEAEKLPQIDPADLLTKAFEKMSDLRLLQVGHAYHDGKKFRHLPQGIKWLSLKGISCKCVPTISHLKKLAVLDLSGSDITDDWGGWQQIQLISTLKVLDLSRCRFLESTPHFSCDTSLERLILDRCIRLSVFHESIEHLQKLVFLSLNWCNILKDLPDGICKLSSIKSLILFQCSDLEKLPKEWGNMKSLTELIIDHTKIEEIPDSIGLLEKLERLSARECHKLKKLPNLSKLKSLQALCLTHCWEHFEIQGISGLSLLQQLDLEYCRKLKLLPELPPGLIKLNIEGCTSMERLPNLSTLKNLKELRLDNCNNLAKIEDISGLTLLQELNLTGYRRLLSLAELPSSLIKLDATDCSSIERLPNFSNLKILQALLLSYCRTLSEIQGISGLSLLQKLDLKRCTELQSLPELPPSLIILDIRGCVSLERLPNLSTLKHLKEFRLDNCCKLAEIEGIDELTLLQKLDLRICRKLQSLPELPSSLIELDARKCFSIERLANLSNLTNLQVLHLCCWKLSEIQDISGLSLLKELDLEDCKMLQSLPRLPPSLKVLLLDNCMELANIQSINDLTLLQKLHLKICAKLQSLDLSNLRILETLHLEGCDNLAEIRGLESLESLTELRVCRYLTYIKTLSKSVAEGWLPTAANEGEIRNNYLIPEDDNIKGTIFYLVYQLLIDPAALFWGMRPDIFCIEAEIRRNGCNRTITCVNNLRVEGMKNANTDKDGFYSCYFQGLTWFGFPLKKRDIIHVTNASFQKTSGVEFCNTDHQRSKHEVKVKLLDLVMEYEAMEDSQQLEKRVVPLITSTTKKRPREYDDAGPSNWDYN